MTKRKRFDAVARTSAIAVFEDELKTRSDGYVEHLAHGGKADCGEEFYLDALYMAIAALREQPRWISVEEGLPKINTKVLVRYKHTGEPNKRSTAFDYLRVGEINPTVFHWTQHPLRVTHWMPLPEPPKEEV